MPPTNRHGHRVARQATLGSGHAIGGRSMVEVRGERDTGGTVSDVRGDGAAVNVASCSAGVRPLRAMEKRS